MLEAVLPLPNFRHVIRKYSLHNETTKNGKLLCQLAEANQLIIKSTCFQHKNIHKGTWKIPGTGEVNQIDHVLISKRHSSSITDVKSARGPNCDSDHYLVKVLFREKLANVSNLKGSKRTRWNIEKLQQPEIVTQYQKTLSRKLNELSMNNTEESSVDKTWNEIKKVVGESAKEIIGERKGTRGVG